MFYGEAWLTSEEGFCLQKHSLPICCNKHKLDRNGCVEVQLGGRDVPAAFKNESASLMHCPRGNMGEVLRLR